MSNRCDARRDQKKVLCCERVETGAIAFLFSISPVLLGSIGSNEHSTERVWPSSPWFHPYEIKQSDIKKRFFNEMEESSTNTAFLIKNFNNSTAVVHTKRKPLHSHCSNTQQGTSSIHIFPRRPTTQLTTCFVTSVQYKDLLLKTGPWAAMWTKT